MCAMGINPGNEIQDRRSNALRNGIIGTTTGAIVGGGLGYFTTKVVKDGAPTDKFVHNVTKEYFIDLFKKNSMFQNAVLDIRLDKLKEFFNKDSLTQEELKTFLEKNKKLFKKDLECFNNGNPGEITTKFNKLIKKYNKNFNYIKEQLVKSYDATTKKFNYINMKLDLGALAGAIEKALKIRKAVKYGAIGAIGLGAISFIATKLKEQ